MIRLALLAALLVVAVPSIAHARWMGHADLAGLVLESDAIVVAARGAATNGTYTRVTTYRVTRSIVGPLAVGTELALDDFLYDVSGLTLDPQAVLFLARASSGQWQIVGSGLRVVAHGEVIRFEQWDNPGGWHVVPQGVDPLDVRGDAAAEHGVSMEVFLGALEAARGRAAALTAAVADPDPSRRRGALLGLLAAPRPDDLDPGGTMGFYMDVLAQRAEAALLSHGDVDGLALALLRDRSANVGRAVAGIPSALAFAAIAGERGRPTDVRRGALVAMREATDLADDPRVIDTLVALLGDTAPVLRVSAALTLGRAIGGQSSDPAQELRLRRPSARSRAALRGAFGSERNPSVLYAIDVALTNASQAVPSRRGLFAVAHAVVRGGVLSVDLRILAATASVRSAEVVADGPAGAPAPASIRWQTSGGTSSGVDSPPSSAGFPSAGSHPFEAVLHLAGGRTERCSVGILVVDAQGARVEPPADVSVL